MTNYHNENEQNNADDEAALAIIRRISNGKALRPPSLPDKQTISVRLSTIAKDGLQRIATEMGYTHNHHGNISMLLEAIGTDTVLVTPKLL